MDPPDYMMILRPFDPWRGSLCTCPEKLSLNPYTGCAHGCLYCYASSYIRHFSDCRPKGGIDRLSSEIARLRGDELISLSNSSDPYPPVEKELGITRSCISLIKRKGLRLQVVTKSDIVLRDVDLLSDMRAAVSITITSLRLDDRLEPGAPSSIMRLKAIRKLTDEGIPVAARIDPIIPGMNDSEIDALVESVADAGASYVISSTYKARQDSWRRMSLAFPEVMQSLRPMYFVHGERIGGYRYLPHEIRHAILSRVRDACHLHGIRFGSCREGFGSDASCDGSHLTEAQKHRILR
ncbi:MULTISPECIES: SPL family radical SAM protein [Methanothrix]|uniref:Radical SAM domain protein n=1 Tax=Methanothrix thermoacetophila (strain DSM 6194 / JCM 14653 / NBRC 101360 / PT) TaxID=349307 RepID=A0B8N5_METTP|nr:MULTISPECIES: radical SAM protein [Methanothrix]ABK15059.1 Radical SAM domain protein [Methanothrix thermoacetophila PT]